ASLIRKAFRAMHSSPTLTVNRLCDWKWPVITVVERLAKRGLFEGWPLRKKERKLVQEATGIVREGEVDRFLRTARHEPSISLDTDGNPEHTLGTSQFYTDGSRTPGCGPLGRDAKVGSGIIMIDASGRVTGCWRRKHMPHGTVYQAEAHGIAYACQTALAMLRSGSPDLGAAVEVVSDCLSALREISRGGADKLVPTVIREARVCARNLLEAVQARGMTFRLRWAKAHIGHHHNALADLAARQAAQTGVMDGWRVRIPWAHVREKVRNWHEFRVIDPQWKKRKVGLKGWRSSRVDLGRAHRKLLEGVSKGDDRRRIVEVITGHGAHKAHFAKIQSRVGGSSRSCPWCGAAEESVEHVIYICPAHVRTRQWVKRRLGYLPAKIAGFLTDRGKLHTLVWMLRRIWPNTTARGGGVLRQAATRHSPSSDKAAHPKGSAKAAQQQQQLYCTVLYCPLPERYF
ncbi:hypothetical protein FOZ63_004991, partial [Perkinsus olseni]